MQTLLKRFWLAVWRWRNNRRRKVHFPLTWRVKNLRWVLRDWRRPRELGPEDNPFLNDPHNEYRRRQWDQRRGWYDYS